MGTDFLYERVSPRKARVCSPGPHGKVGTEDDIFADR